MELVISRRNERRLANRGGVREHRDGFLGLAAVHASVYVALPLEWAQAPWVAIGPHTAVLLAIALAASALRYWAAVSLGAHYTVRVWRVQGAPMVRHGPYRWMRHPIYRAVLVELPAVPLAFGAFVTAAVIFVLQAAALRRRIRVEERFLATPP